MSQDWFTLNELEGYAGIARFASARRYQAERDNWRSQRRAG